MPQRRKPVELRLLEGTHKPSVHGPAPEPGDHKPPTKPADLTGEAAKVWASLVKLLKPVIRESDGPLLVELCRWWAELKKCQTVIHNLSPVEPGYNKVLIGVGICSDKVDKLAARFGLTPSDRAKLRFEAAGPPTAKVATRPKTKLDKQGGP
jgi:phage terminase small subunit